MTPELRPLPTETVDGLRPPREGFPYFAHADAFPFEPQARGHSPANAWWLADACFLCYGAAPFIEAALAQSPLPGMGFQLSWLGTPEDNRGIVLSSEESLILVFRGTRLQKHSLLDSAEVVLMNQYDLWTDSQLWPAVSQHGGRVHAGFTKAYADVNERIDTLVRARLPGQRVWLAGHSLGGALATLAAAHLGAATVQGVYTYGCPRVGNAEFAKALSAESHCRFVHRHDWVPAVPPELLGYRHAGELCPVPGSTARNLWDDFTRGASEFSTAMTAMAKALRMSMGDIPFKVSGLADHAPIYYSTLLWNALMAGKDPAAVE